MGDERIDYHLVVGIANVAVGRTLHSGLGEDANTDGQVGRSDIKYAHGCRCQFQITGGTGQTILVNLASEH
jgi:hypothetical protein